MDANVTLTESARTRRRRWAGVWVLCTGIVALPLGSMAVMLAREQLHFGCTMGPIGSEGPSSWSCSDGVSYVGIVVVLGGMCLFVLVLGFLVAMFDRKDRPARQVLVALATLSSGWVLGWTWYGANQLVGSGYAPMSGPEYWGHAVGPAAVVIVIALAAGFVSLVGRWRASRVAGVSATIGLAIATALQPGLAINTLPAVGLLAAAILRGDPIRARAHDSVAS